MEGRRRCGGQPARCFDDRDLKWADLDTVDYGSTLSGHENRCLQVGILGSLSEKSGPWVQDLRASFVESCGSDARSGFFERGAEVDNLQKTCSVLQKYRVGVWIVIGRTVTHLRRGFSAGKLYIGSARAMSVGVVVWLKEDRHVVVPRGNCLKSFLASVPVITSCPIGYDSVGAPKGKKKFRGGDPGAAGRKSGETRRATTDSATLGDVGADVDVAESGESAVGRRRSERLVAKVERVAQMEEGAPEACEKDKDVEMCSLPCGEGDAEEEIKSGSGGDDPVDSDADFTAGVEFLLRSRLDQRMEEEDVVTYGESASDADVDDPVDSEAEFTKDLERRLARIDHETSERSAGKAGERSEGGASMDDPVDSDAEFTRGVELRTRIGGEETRRGRSVRMSSDVWKRFTPAVIDERKCLARTFGGGRGDQCRLRPLPGQKYCCLLYTSPSPRDRTRARMPSSA